MVGNIYLAKIYFTDLSKYKIRPVLVIKEMNEDCICLQLTSQMKDKRILITNNELSEGHLIKDSMVVVPKNFTLHKTILIKKIGKVNKALLNTIFRQFCDEIGCNT